MNLIRKLRTWARLGPLSLARVGLYRLGLMSGLHSVFRARPATLREGAIFPQARRPRIVAAPSPAWADRHWAFGQPVGGPTEATPDWHANIFTGVRSRFRDQRWDRVPAFSSEVGDIKTVWESSRFDWVVTLAQRVVLGEVAAHRRLNDWLSDWAVQNPTYLGPNWMCGQEASIRVLHLALAALIMDVVETPSEALQDLLFTHLRRIRPTVSYALGQDNNHATSEASALFIGGAWLARHGSGGDERRKAEAEEFAAAGRRLMDRSVSRLVFDDGGFSQYSTVYHRVMLDTLSVAELFRRRFDEPRFADETVKKLEKATIWLDSMTDAISGDAPNMGANDGAWLLPIGPGGARDFRPSIALASALLRGRSRFGETSSARDLLAWLEIDASSLPEESRPLRRDFGDSGMVLMDHDRLRAWLRVPRFRFRPSQADALHLDIWFDGIPLFVDSGSYSYADPDRGGGVHFGSVAAHNTVQFDGRDQMPRLGRFLFAEWLSAEFARHGPDHVEAKYSDYRGATHRRDVLLEDRSIVVTDTIDGFDAAAVLRWRTAWAVRMSGDCLEAESETGERFTARFSVNGEVVIPVVTAGEVSLFYHRTERVNVIEIHTIGPARVVTEIQVEHAFAARRPGC